MTTMMIYMMANIMIKKLTYKNKHRNIYNKIIKNTMAKVIKLKDRQGSVVLPLTRSQLVQVSQITGLDIDGGWTSKSVQDALQALVSYVNTNKAAWDADLTKIKTALTDVLDASRAVANYVDSAKNLSYAKAESEADAAEQAAKDYADGKFLTQVKLNNEFVNVKTDANGRYVDLGSIATSDSLQTLTEKVNAIEAAYITKTASDEADQAIITSYKDADTALGNRIDEVITSYKAADSAIITGYTQADTAIISSYTAADSAIITAYQAADAALTSEINALKSSYTVSLTEAAGSGDVLKVYTISQGGNSIGTINIPKDLVATSGSLVYCTKSGNTYTETTADAAGAIACIKMTIQNGNPFYIEVADLIEYNSVKSNSEITLTDTGHEIEATVGSISSSKITFTPAGDNPTDTTVQAALRDLYSQIGEGGSVSSQIQTEIEKLDADLDATGTAQHSGTFVVSGVTEVDGKITAVDSVEVETAGAAAAVKTELLGDADTNNNTLGKIADRIDTLNGAAVKKVNNQTPNANGEVTVNASQIDTVNTYKIGSDQSATTHTVDEVLAAGVYFEEVSATGTYDDVNLTL